jgi:hypothetical protein
MNATANKTLSVNKGAANKPADKGTLSFFQTLTAIAAPIAKLSSNQAQQDPKLAMRTRFEKSVTEQVALVKSAADKSRWFKKVGEGYEMTVRNGNSAMTLDGHTYFQAKDAAGAVAFYEAVIAGTKAGELDAALQESMRKPRAAKAPAAAPGAAPAAKK